MKVLVIGGTGNISRWFVQMLADRGDECTLYNRGRRSVPFSGKISYVRGDRTDAARFVRDMKALPRFDCVIDMVAYEPEEAQSVIQAFAGRTGQYIFCSTVDVYRKPQAVYPVPQDGLLGPSPDFGYAWKKWQLERTLQQAAAEEKFPLTIIRPGATYSEGWSPLITTFGGDPVYLGRLLQGKRMILHDQGAVLWSLTHSEDVARAFFSAAGNPSTIGEVYNVTGDQYITWETMHRIVAEELGAPLPRFVYIPTKELGRLVPEQAEWCMLNFQFNNLFSNQKAKEELGFTYSISYTEGVRRCLEALQIPDTSEPIFYEALLQTWDEIRHASYHC